MVETRWIMGMPITVNTVDEPATKDDIERVFEYFRYIDEKFSTYKDTSEITKVNRGELEERGWSDDMMIVMALCEETKLQTQGYFDIKTPKGTLDPSGLVKGWAINNAAGILDERGRKNFYIEAGGDIQVRGKNAKSRNWTVGIRNPFNTREVVKLIRAVNNEGIATSGTYIRGQHVYNPREKSKPLMDIISFTVIGPDIYEADRFATAAFAMGREGINFIENLAGFEGYSIDKEGRATMTNGFGKYVLANNIHNDV